MDELRARLDAFARAYDRRHLGSDPLGIVRRFDRPEDLELVGLLAAGLAYGRVASIRASLDSLLRILGPRPGAFVEAYRPATDARRFEGFRHRFTSGRDVALLLHLVAQARAARGPSLEALFLEGDADPSSPTLEAAMDRFGDALFRFDARPFLDGGRVPPRDGARRLLPVPRNGSACKRHCLFLRWMVRPDDGLDLGLWSRVPPSRLVVPLDTHMERIAAALGWTRRRSPGWRMALEVTAALRRLDPEDPTRYDFPLSRLGILGIVRARGGRIRAGDVAAILDAAGGETRCETP